MKNYAQGLGGVIHCYSYSREMAEEYVKMGFYIGIGGVVTFKNAKKLKDVAAAIPIEDRAGDRLPVYGTGAVPWQTESVFLYPVCG